MSGDNNNNRMERFNGGGAISMTRADRVIPVTKLPEGLRLCANNVREFVADARNLIAKGHGWHAIALAMFAYEELGKYAELLRHSQSAKGGQDSVNVKDELFSSHIYKYGIASKLIPEDAKIIVPGVAGLFGSAYFDAAYFDIGTPPVTPSDTLRAQCVYVDWVDDDWRHGTPHDTEQIKKFLNSIIDTLSKLETNP
jgi:AbiV family abortive infection protein